MAGSRSPSLWWRKRPRSFGETTDISEYPHRGAGRCAATAPLAPRRASRPPPDRTRYASQCDDVRYATSLGGIKALLTEPPFSAPPPPPPLSLPGSSADNQRVTGFSAGARRVSREMRRPKTPPNRLRRPRRHLVRRYERRHPRRPRD